MNILHIDSSPFVNESVSRTLSKSIVAAYKKTIPDADVIYLDLGLNPPAHLSAAAMNVLRKGETSKDSEATKQEVQAINHAVDQLMNCDVLVIGAPMYNHSIPSNLKSWLDQVCQAGRTFRYTDKGPLGLVNNKKTIIASSRGGIYSDEKGLLHDFQEPFLISILGFLGLNDVTIIRAEGVSLPGEARAKAMANAQEQINQLCPSQSQIAEQQIAE